MGCNICFKVVICKIAHKLYHLPFLIWSTDILNSKAISCKSNDLTYFAVVMNANLKRDDSVSLDQFCCTRIKLCYLTGHRKCPCICTFLCCHRNLEIRVNYHLSIIYISYHLKETNMILNFYFHMPYLNIR